MIFAIYHLPNHLLTTTLSIFGASSIKLSDLYLFPPKPAKSATDTSNLKVPESDISTLHFSRLVEETHSSVSNAKFLQLGFSGFVKSKYDNKKNAQICEIDILSGALVRSSQSRVPILAYQVSKP